MLLSDEKVANILREEVIPVWEAVRPAPKVTIDFGNGQKMERTIKGNTAMYLCTADRQVIDVYPGVYLPHDFIPELEKGLAQIDSGKTSPPELAAWHKDQVNLSISNETRRTTMSKAFVESPLLKAIGAAKKSETLRSTETTLDPGDMQGAFDALASRLEDISNNPNTAKASAKEAGMKANGLDPERIALIMLSEDSQANMRSIRPGIHLLLALQSKHQQPSDLRDTIFKKLLHIPIDDPFLGLNDTSMPGTPKGG